MSEDDHSANQLANSKEENSGPSPEDSKDEEGYQTPTSEESKIPKVVISCPPPPPKKRKRLLLNGKSIKQPRLHVLSSADLEVVFKPFDAISKAAPPPSPPPA
ncbi:hypothetical protein ACS0TY_014563 [Phlomoides rotata]